MLSEHTIDSTNRYLLHNFVAWQQAWLLRGISVLLASIATMLMIAWPKTLIGHIQPQLLMISLLLCFVHGIGLIPANLRWRCLFTPVIGWPMVVHFFYNLLSKAAI